MSEILFAPLYAILFGRLSIAIPKEKYNKIDVDQSFYEGFGIEL